VDADYGETFGRLLRGKPASAFLADGSEVAVSFGPGSRVLLSSLWNGREERPSSGLADQEASDALQGSAQVEFAVCGC
jgi:hypothetical protein